MNKYKCCLGLAILATLVTTPAQAESVSRKAADLMAQNSNSINSIKLPDLQVTNLATTTTPLYTGKEFYLTYKVENKGLTGATGSWTDKVYLSSDNRLDSNDNLIAENTFTPDTPFNSSYERNIPFLTPSTAGQYYLITIIDANNTLNEGKGLREENNSVFIPITVISANTPPSSSAVSEPSYPSSDTDSKLPASNYFYLGASVGRGFPSDIKLKAKATDAATIQSLRNNDIPNEFRAKSI